MDYDKSINEFREKFLFISNKKLVIYGTGVMAKKLLARCKDFHILGVIDVNRKASSFCEKPILLLNDIEKLDIYAIIVAAKVENYKIIYDRIGNYTGKHNIPILGMNGWNLNERYGYIPRQLKVPVSFYHEKAFIYNQIKKCDVVSFSVYDVLVIHKYLSISDFFEIIEYKAKMQGIVVPQFARIRMEEEKKAKKNGNNILEIYNNLKKYYKLSETDNLRLLELEIKNELLFLSARSQVIDLWNFAVSQNKKVYIVETSCTNKIQMKGLLDQFNIKGYQDILTTGEYHKIYKSELLEMIKSGENGKKLLHIDNDIYEGKRLVEKLGIDIALIPGIKEMQKNSSWEIISKYTYTVNDRMILGYCMAEVFADPFKFLSSDGRIAIETVQQIGKICLMPVAVRFISWMMDMMQNENIEKVLFSARDGYLFQKLYEIARGVFKEKKNPPSEYFLISRKACMRAGIQNEEDLISVYQYIQNSNVDIQQFLINKNERNEREMVNMPMSSENKWKYLQKHADEIYQISEIRRKNYQIYLESLSLKNDKIYALYDGLCHGTPMRIFQKNFPLHLKGYFFGLLVNQNNVDLDIKALYKIDDAYQCKSGMRAYAFFFEVMCASPMPALKGFDQDGNPEYDDEGRCKEHLDFIQEVQVGAEEMFSDYIRNAFLPGIHISAELVELLLPNQNRMKFGKNAAYLYQLKLIDDMGDSSYKVMQ